MRRMIAAVTGALCGAVLLAGCSPPRLPLAAVWLDGGRPWALTLPCGDDPVNGVSLASWPDTEQEEPDRPDVSSSPTPTSSADALAAWRALHPGWTSESRHPLSRRPFPLFEPPASFEAEWSGPAEQAPRPGYQYVLEFRSYDDDGFLSKGMYRGDVFVTTEELATLRPGQVWADSRAMSRDGFLELVADRC
ncbi:hypothetical protein ACFWM0_29350 [Streptomyces sp. NPDC058405]|uniref:hypothetical protein n=1 Tax=Streptomyces sp. NPDC058405 TaxID=3346482 RepID=UPI003663278A